MEKFWRLIENYDNRSLHLLYKLFSVYILEGFLDILVLFRLTHLGLFTNIFIGNIVWDNLLK